jgi:hypothetical protein
LRVEGDRPGRCLVRCTVVTAGLAQLRHPSSWFTGPVPRCPLPPPSTARAQALQPIVALRAHLHSLSRRVLLGHGLYDGLPIDLFIGSLSSELAALLRDAPPPDAAAAAAAAAGAGGPRMAAAAGALAGLPWGAPPAHVAALPQHVVDFFTASLPLPQLAVLVFTQFVGIDPAPAAPAAALPAAPAAPATPDGAGGAQQWQAGREDTGGAPGGAGRGSSGAGAAAPLWRAGGRMGSHQLTSPGKGGGGFGAGGSASGGGRAASGGGAPPAAAGSDGGGRPVTFEAAASAAAATVKALASDLSWGSARR